jgi:type IV pilus assembly protein PilQ
MVFFQRNTITDRLMTCLLILVAVIAAGCTPLKTQVTGSTDSQVTGSSDSQVTGSTDSRVQDESQALFNQIQAIAVQSSGRQVTVRIKTDQKPVYTAIKQDFPFGIAIYLPDTRISQQYQPSGAAPEPVKSIRAGYADQEKTTAKIEVLLNQDLPYVVEARGNDLAVVLAQTLPETSGEHTSAAMAPGTPVVSSLPDTGQPGSPAPGVSQSTAKMTGIEFNTSQAGHADIQVTTTHPVRYDTVWQSDTRLDLILYNTRIPQHHQRPLLTRYHNSAVDRILPQHDPVDTQAATIEILIREKVPYRIVQDHNLISVQFDPAGMDPQLSENTVKPVIGDGAQAGPENGKSLDARTVPALPEALPGRITEGQILRSSWDAATGQGQTQYTGEKIKLDFYDTDIKNVFRILKSVSGLNFAVDKDVQGKVTMTLEKPVPWDQVLDLVLKMNGLGRKMEGDVVRIATIQTLKKEDQDLQDAIAARKKAQEQQKSLEPLVTEYIPINYSNAKADIEQQITPLLTPDRGSVSVDQRNNMIIVTDTREKVDQIQEMIYRLDTVTPQIMIEVKVVEVTRDFSRSLGVGWNLSNDPTITSGFVNDMNVSVNTPVGDGGISGDFSFFRVFGSSVTALNAKLAASETQGDVRIVSSPRILTLNNKTARIKQGQEIAYLERDDAGGSAVNFKDVDLLLEVTPQVTPDERISMRVFLTKNDVAGFTPQGVPFLATNEAETELLVNDNETVVIGGIVKTTLSDDKSGLPFLTGIPILGDMLLGSTTKEDTRNELLIFLSPSIVQLEQKKQAARETD